MNRNTFIPIALVVAAFLAAAAFFSIRQRKDGAAPAPAEVAAVETVAEQPAEELAEPEQPVEQPAEQPKPKRPKRSAKEASEDFGSMLPIGMDNRIQEMPTKEEVIDYAYEMLDSYRNGTDEERMQMRMATGMAQVVMSAMSGFVAGYVQQLDPDQRQQLLAAADASREILDAVQLEMAGAATDEEIAVFGGAFQSMRTLNESILDAAVF